MLTRKIALMIRIMAKYPITRIKLRSLICVYTTMHRKGTKGWLGLDGEDTHTHNFGPVSHLLVDLHKVGATIDDEFTIHQGQEPPFPLTTTPWQFIRPLTTAMAQRARYTHAH